MNRLRGTAALLTLFLTVGGFQDPQDISTKVDQLVEQLKKLSPGASRDDFLKRPAMSRLMSFGLDAIPGLKNHFLKDDDWAIKSSVGYLLITLVQNRDAEVTRRWSALSTDPNPFVRATMASLTGEVTPSCVVTPRLTNAEDRAIYDRLRLDASVQWMAAEDLRSLTRKALAVLETGKPLLEPPSWRFGRGTQGDPARLRSAGLRVVKPECSTAQLALIRIFDSPGAYEALEAVMECAETDDGSDQARLGVKLRMAALGRGHQGGKSPPCWDNNCPVGLKYENRLYRVCEKWAWKATDPNAQYGVITGLRYAGLWKAHDLLERMSKEHPDAQVKELSGSGQANYWNGLLDRGHTREREKEDDERLKKEEKSR